MQFYFFNPAVSTYAYVTYQDIKQGSLRDQTVIVVKAPTDTKLEVPDPEEVCIHAHKHTRLIFFFFFFSDHLAYDLSSFIDKTSYWLGSLLTLVG